MKTLNKVYTTLVVALAGLSLAACSSEDLSTDQYVDGVNLTAFGPCPVLRGGTLFLYGSNLDQISEVDLPGADPITSFEVLTAGRNSKISISVPAEKCDTGRIVLKTIKGATITSVSPITYTENIKLDTLYIGNNMANFTGSVGDTLTLKGDYLNLMHGVIFEENDTVYEEDFVAHDRYTIKVKIPATAKTGEVTLTDLATEPNELNSEYAITINLPVVKAIPTTAVKAGQTLTINGESLDQIKSIELNGTTIDADDFKSHSDKEITVTVPALAADGEVNLVTMSGVKIPAGSLKTVVPTELVANPNPVKNGAEITITGKDLDLVTSISMPNVTNGDYKLKVTENKITAVVPETAQEGDITLTLANGRSVTVAYKLVTPTVTGCIPESLIAGNAVVIRGTDLDLVASVILPGNAAQTVSKFSAHTASAIGLTVPAACSGSGMTLVLKNGIEVKVEGQLTIKAATTPAVSSVSKAVPGETVTIKGANFQNAESIYFGDAKVTKYTSRSNGEIVCTVPTDAVTGEGKLIIVTYDGEKVETAVKVQSKETDVVSDWKCTSMDGTAVSYPYTFTWGDDGRFRLMKSNLIAAGAKVGSKLIFYITPGTTGQVQISDANWGNAVYASDWTGAVDKIEYVFDAATMTAINETSDGWSDTALILQGGLEGITKIGFLP